MFALFLETIALFLGTIALEIGKVGLFGERVGLHVGDKVSDDLRKLKTKNDLYLTDESDLVWTFIGISRFYNGQGLYAEAEPWSKACLTVVRSLLGTQHPDTALSLWNLAALYADQGRLTEAKPLLVQALEVFQQRLGNQHSDTVGAQNWLEGVRQRMGQVQDGT